MKYSFDKYCDLCDKYEDYEYRCDDWFPTIAEANQLLDNINKEFDYIVWILETASDEIKEAYHEEYSYLSSSFNESVEWI